MVPSLAGPKRPQDRVDLAEMKESFNTLFSKPTSDNGFNQPAEAWQPLSDQAQRAGSVANDNALKLPGDGGQPRNVVEMVNDA